MLPSVVGSLGQPPLTRPRYQLCYLGKNHIGAEGCRHLKGLHTLSIGESYDIQRKIVSDLNEGCGHLSKVQWKNLHTLYLSISCPKQWSTISELKDAIICLWLSGPSFTNYLASNNIGDECCRIYRKLSGPTSTHFAFV